MGRRIKRRKPKLKLLALPGRQAQGSSDLNPEQILARREEAMRLRLDENLTYREIAERMGVDRNTAHKDCQIIVEMKLKGMIEKDTAVLLENNNTYDKILSAWMPLLKPFLDGEVQVRAEKTNKKGEAYYVDLPTFEAAKTATEMVLKAAAQRERLNGYGQSSGDRKPAQEALEGAGMALFELLRQHAARPPEPKTIEATVIDG